MIERRQFLALLAAAPALGKIPVREAGRVETVFKSPGPYPNGLQATDEGLWIIDGEDARAHLVSYSDGAVLLGFDTEAVHPSGITFDGEAIWVASTYSREIIRADASSGKTIEKYFTPGAGVIYRMPSDPPGRQSPLAPASPPPSATSAPVEPRSATGAHGLEWREGKLWAAVPPSRMIYRIDPESWMVEQRFPSAGNRPHGIGWEGGDLWCTDTNLNAFFKHDPGSGEIIEKIQLADDDPLPHGMTIRDGVLWYCDDVGIVCRLKL